MLSELLVSVGRMQPVGTVGFICDYYADGGTDVSVVIHSKTGSWYWPLPVVATDQIQKQLEAKLKGMGNYNNPSTPRTGRGDD
jgi:hypothetical protein